MIDAAKYLGCSPMDLASSQLPWLAWGLAHFQIHKDFEAAVEGGQDRHRRGRARGEPDPAPTETPPRQRPGQYAFGETPPRDNRSRGDGGFAERMRAALQEREEREAERNGANREAGGL